MLGELLLGRYRVVSLLGEGSMGRVYLGEQRVGEATRRVAIKVLAAARGNEALTLEVRAGNERAIALYRRIGMAPAGVRKGYYEDDGEDALILWCHDLADAGYPARLDQLDSYLRKMKGRKS